MTTMIAEKRWTLEGPVITLHEIPLIPVGELSKAFAAFQSFKRWAAKGGVYSITDSDLWIIRSQVQIIHHTSLRTLFDTTGFTWQHSEFGVTCI